MVGWGGRMHPLFSALQTVKLRLLTQDGGLCCDLFCSPLDCQVYSSTAFQKVLMVAHNERIAKLVEEGAPTRPVVALRTWCLDARAGVVSLAAWLAGQGPVSAVWMQLHRKALSATSLASVCRTLHVHAVDRGCVLYVLVLNGDLARQMVLTGEIDSDSSGSIFVDGEKQNIDGLSMDETVGVISRNGFALVNRTSGDRILDMSATNALPMDRNVSRIVHLLQFSARPSFGRWVATEGAS